MAFLRRRGRRKPVAPVNRGLAGSTTARTRDMPLDAKLKSRFDQALRAVDDHVTSGTRLVDDAQRLWTRVRSFIEAKLIAGGLDEEGLELACYAMQLPLRRQKMGAAGRVLRTNLRSRAEEAAEMLIAIADEDADELLLDRTTRILQETHQRSPMLDEARLLADAVNLEDFGLIGMLHQLIQLARDGDGIVQLAEGCRKREQYGYWEARLKDGFHFDQVRMLAHRRLDNARLLCSMLMDELDWAEE